VTLTTAAGLVQVDEWHHLAATEDRDNPNGALRVINIYVDGVLRATGTGIPSALRGDFSAFTAASAIFAGNPLYIGHSAEAQGNFEGTLDDVRLWSVVRTGAQIAGAKDAELAGTLPGGLVMYLKANEGTGLVLGDAAGANSAQLKNVYSTGSGVVAGRIDHPGQRDFYTFTLATASSCTSMR